MLSRFNKLYSADKRRAVEMELCTSGTEVDEWEIAVDRIVLQEVIGRGAFGAVWRALLKERDGKSGNRIVATKCFTRKVLLISVVLVSFAAVAWARHAMLPPPEALREKPKQRLRRRLQLCVFSDKLKKRLIIFQ